MCVPTMIATTSPPACARRPYPPSTCPDNFPVTKIARKLLKKSAEEVFAQFKQVRALMGGCKQHKCRVYKVCGFIQYKFLLAHAAQAHYLLDVAGVLTVQQVFTRADKGF